MARSPHTPGFTLIELMIVMTLIALLAAAAGPALGALTGADARKGAGEIAGTMRWLFDSAAVRHATCRLVISPAERSFWAECAPSHTTIRRDPEDEDAPAPPPEKDEEGEAHGKDGGVQAPGFAKFEDPIVRTRELPGGAEFTAVRVDGRDVLSGTRPAYIHFFPGGRAQAARVTIADGGHVFTIRLEPFTGRARVSAGEPEGRDE